MSYPVFLTCRDRLSSVAKMVEWFEKVGNADEIYLIDNDSQWPPLLEYYEKTPHTVLRQTDNTGHLVGYHKGIFLQYANGRHFISSDSDIVPTEECPDDALDLMIFLLDVTGARKVGFSLKLDDIPDSYPHKAMVLSHESQFWEDYDPALLAYKAPIDGTFAMYQPWAAESHDIWNCFRTAEPYVARHISWYLDPTALSEEEQFVKNRIDRTLTHWSNV